MMKKNNSSLISHALAGTGIGFVYNTIIGATTPWFPDKKGTASGIMMLGFGFSSLVLGNLAAKLFDVIGWENVFRLYGIGIGAVLAIIGCILRMPGEGEVPAAAAAAAMQIRQCIHYKTASHQWTQFCQTCFDLS